MISVIIPVYNREQTIKKALNSVLNQTYKDIEVIVVDDGSTDASKKVIESISDKRIKYVYQENAGACVARNTGIEMAKGEFIAFHDSDDEWVFNKLEIQLKELNNHSADVVFGQMSLEGKLIPDRVEEGFITTLEFLKYSNIIGTPTIMGKSSCFKDIKFDPLMPRLQDRELAIRLSKKYKIYFIKKPLLIIERQENSISNDNIKGEVAISRIIETNRDILSANRDIENELLTNLCYFKIKNKKDCSREFRRIIKNKPSLNSIGKFIAYKLGILQWRYNKL